MATMKDVAALAGVSIATVSHVLSGKRPVTEAVKNRVLEAIELTNYTPNTIAQSLRMNQTQTIGVLVEDIRAFPVSDIVDGISGYLEGHEYRLILNNLRLMEKIYNRYDLFDQYRKTIGEGLQLLLNAQVDGVIYVSMHDRRIDDILPPLSKPVVFAYAYSSRPLEPSVFYDNEGSAQKIVRVLIENGHKRIAIIGGHVSSSTVKLRLRGYKNALEEAGLTVPAEYIRWGDWEFESGIAETEKLLAIHNRPTAIFAMNDIMAAGCYTAAQRLGLHIPEDISIAGFDNREIASYLYPPLTTLQLPHKQIGQRSAQLMIERLRSTESEFSNIELPCEVILRGSIAPARA